MRFSSGTSIVALLRASGNLEEDLTTELQVGMAGMQIVDFMQISFSAFFVFLSSNLAKKFNSATTNGMPTSVYSDVHYTMSQSPNEKFDILSEPVSILET